MLNLPIALRDVARKRPARGSRTGRRRNRLSSLERLEARRLLAATLFRVNAGGPELAATPAWTADTEASPSAYVNAADAGNRTASTGATIDTSHASIPDGTPMEMFQTERWDPPSSAEMQWSFPVNPGAYEVRLYFAETYGATQAVGERVFDVSIEGELRLDDYDIFADVGGDAAVMKSFVINSDDSLDIQIDREVSNPALKGIEILTGNHPPVLDPIGPQNVAAGETLTVSVSSSDADSNQTRSLTLEGLPSFATFTDQGDGTGTLVLSPETSDVGTYSGTLTVTDDADEPLSDSETFTVEVLEAMAPLYRVNAGGALVAGEVDWTADTETNPSPYINANETGNRTYSTGETVDTSHASIPAGTPMELFQSERWDHPSSADMLWSFPVDPGGYEVRLYFAETYAPAHEVGARVFDVSIEGQLQLDDYDIFAEVGDNAAVMKSFVVNSDDSLGIQFDHEVSNPAVKAIEILPTHNHPPVLDPIGLQSVVAGETLTIPVSSSDLDSHQTRNLELQGLPSFATFTDAGDGTGTIVLSPQTSDVGTYSGTLTVTDDAGTKSLTDTETFTVEVLQGNPGATPLYRINTGGPTVTDSMAWAADTATSPSTYVNANETGNRTYSTGDAVDTSHASIPAGIPMELFQSERWDSSSSPDMQWAFPVEPGAYEVRLYFAETYEPTQAIGARTFDVLIEGQLQLDDYDIFAEVGGNAGVMESIVVNSDDSLDIRFGHEEMYPAVKAIEILPAGNHPPVLDPIGLQSVAAGETLTIPVSSSDLDSDQTRDLELQGLPSFATFTDAGDGTGTIVLSPQAGDAGTYSATVTVTDDAGSASLSDSETFTVKVFSNTTATPLYRINTGGPAVTSSMAWSADTAASPSTYVNATEAGSTTNSTDQAIDLSHSSVPAGAPMELFQSERWDDSPLPEMQWSFPVDSGTYEVRLFFAEIYKKAHVPGARVFDVSIEEELKLDDYDIFADVGANTAVMKSFVVDSDSSLDIQFGHVVENPAVKAIEILPVDMDNHAPVLDPVGAQSVIAGETLSIPVSSSDADSNQTRSLTLEGLPSFASFTDNGNGTGTVVLTPQTADVGSYSATVTVTDDAGPASLSDSETFAVEVLSDTAASRVYRINAGGALVSDDPDWTADTTGSPSAYVNDSEIDSTLYSTSHAIDLSDPSIPAGTPMKVFQSERWDQQSSPEMQWSFPVDPGAYEVRLYFAEIYGQTQSIGARVFDVSIEGQLKLDDYDVFAEVGGYAGVMKSFIVGSDNSLDIQFGHEVTNPAIKAIEIIKRQQPDTLLASPSSVNLGSVAPEISRSQSFSLVNAGTAGDPDIVISDATVSGDAGFSVDFGSALPITLAPGESVPATVEFAANVSQPYSGTLTIDHSGQNPSLSIPLAATVTQAMIDFGKSSLAGTSLSNPTSLQFGPDGRLYTAQQDGKIVIHTLTRNGANDFAVTDTEAITSIQQLPNHNDDGTANPDVNNRLITGLLVTGTASNPVIYVGSSDPRIGAGSSGEDLDLDTNSGIISRLTWNGSAWEKVDLVRGLPRSEENHTINGMQLDEATGTLYVAMGGNTNMGAPSNNFALLPEYALSAAILSIDLEAIGDSTYDLPTLDDEDHDDVLDASGDPVLDETGTPIDPHDPFGGNDGKNQAKLVPDGPVQVYSPGWRNPYDIVIAENGKMYSIDNGPNSGWGDVPILNEEGIATNQVNEPGVSYGDGLHVIEGPGFYAGHPNPTRASQINTFNNETNPQSPVSVDSPAESTYIPPSDDSLVVFSASTNGLAEYTTPNFAGEMQGNLIAASHDNSIKRIVLDSTGDEVVSSSNLFSNVGSLPLDVTTLGEESAFPGTIWVADYVAGEIVVFEPQDSSSGCPDDDDCDGYTNEDEIANGTDPNNSSDLPPDNDGDFVSDLLDEDDDDDSTLDVEDAFAIDADNGTTTPVGTFYTWENDESTDGLLNLGFTGLMQNGADDYLDLYDPDGLTAGGAAGVLTVDAAGAGTALGSENTQQQAFQFGFDAPSATQSFVGKTSVLSPFSGVEPEADTEMGFYLGTGDQDNYAKLVVSGDDGGAIDFVLEVDGSPTTIGTDLVSLDDVDFIDLNLTIDPDTQEISAEYQISRGGTREAAVVMEETDVVPGAWLQEAMAIGVISTDPTPEDSPVSVTWDHLGVVSSNASGISPAALATITPDGGIDASTYPNGTIWLENMAASGGPKIISVTVDSSTTYLPDIVFDPEGVAGDTDAKELTIDTGGETTGYVVPDDPAVDPFSAAYQKGYQRMTMDFTDFDPGEIITFAVDLDPTTLQGLGGQGGHWPGSISGLEMTGMTVTVNFDDGSSHTGTVFATAGSEGEAKALIAPAPPAAPTLEILGLPGNPSTVSQAEQTVRISGNPGDTVRLLLTEAALEPTDEDLFDVDPYEANRVKQVTHDSGVIPEDGILEIPVTLTDDYDQGGFNHLVAVVDNGGHTGSISEVLVVELDETSSEVAGVTADSAPASTLDVNADGSVSALDALVVINTVNRQSAHGESEPFSSAAAARADVNRDGQVTALDALLVINQLHRQSTRPVDNSTAESEEEAVALVDPLQREEEERRASEVDAAIELLYAELD